MIQSHEPGHPETPPIPNHEATALLRESPVGRLAVVVDGVPDILPVNHMVDHGTVVFRTAPGIKMTAAHDQPVTFEVNGYGLAPGEAWSFVVHGTGRLIHETEALHPPLFPSQTDAKPEVIRVVPRAFTGRRVAVRGGSRFGDPGFELRRTESDTTTDGSRAEARHHG